MILFGLFITQHEGRKEGKQGGWSNAPHKGRWVSRANSHPFPGHQRSHCYQLCFCLHRRRDLSLEAYFHHRIMQSNLTQGAWRSHMPGQPLRGHGLQWISITYGASAPLRVASTASYNSMSKWWHLWCGRPLSSTLAPFYVVSFPPLRPPSSKWTERQVAGRFCCFGFPGSWAAGKVLEAEFPGDWAPHRSWHWEAFVFFDSPATWWRKSSCKLGRKDSKQDGVCVTQARGRETWSRGHGATERNFRVLVSCLDAPGEVIYSLGTSAD